MKKLLWILIIIALVVIGLFVFGSNDDASTGTPDTASGEEVSTTTGDTDVDEALEEATLDENEEIDIGTLV